jgi:histone acetyltransferase MYST1
MDGKSGSPEKPLSDLGKLSYRSFWSGVLLRILQQTTGAITVKELAQKTGFTEEDIISTLQVLGLIKVCPRSLSLLDPHRSNRLVSNRTLHALPPTQFWKGSWAVCVNPKLINQFLELNAYKPPTLAVDPNSFKWSSTRTKK